MEKQEFNVKFTIEKEFLLEASCESEAKEKAKELLENMISENFNVVDTDVLNVTKYNEMMKNVRDVVIEYMDKHSDDMAESHIEAWTSRYAGKSKSDIEFDLDVNYDISSESYTVEESLKIELKDENFELNDSEIEYVQDRFIEAVLENF